jgi:hypothetical protein
MNQMRFIMISAARVQIALFYLCLFQYDTIDDGYYYYYYYYYFVIRLFSLE